MSNAGTFLFPREQREKEEIEKYRMERPKIQQQFSDLKVSRWASILTSGPSPKQQKVELLQCNTGFEPLLTMLLVQRINCLGEVCASLCLIICHIH